MILSDSEKVLEQTPREIIPKVTPSKPHGNTTPQIPQGAGGDEGRLYPHQCPFLPCSPHLSSATLRVRKSKMPTGQMEKLRLRELIWLAQGYSWEAESQA